MSRVRERWLYGVTVSQGEPLLRAGHEPGQQLAVLGVAVALTAVAFDKVVVGRLSLFYDLVFVTLCLALALLVRQHDFFLVAALPPLLTLAVFTLVAAVAPTMVADADDSFVQALVTGLVRHSFAFLAGFVLCRGALGLRLRREAPTD